MIVDARAKADRGMGKVPKTLNVVSDSKNSAKHEFTEATFLKKFNKKRKTSYASVKDIKENLILFCNGQKCHRSSWAACELRKAGMPADKIHIMTCGFPCWKAKGYPTR